MLPVTISQSGVLTMVEVLDHPLIRRKLEQMLLRLLNRAAISPRWAPTPASWIIFAVNEMVFIGTLELLEVEVALKYKIGLGVGGLPLDVFRRPAGVTTSLAILDADDELSDVQFVYEGDITIDLTRSPDEDGLGRRKRKRKRVPKNTAEARKRQRLNHESTDEELEFWADTMESRNDENNNEVIYIGTSPVVSLPSDQQPSGTDTPNSNRIGIFCPRPYRSRLMNSIMAAMDNLPIWLPCPLFKRNGYSLDTMWFLAANEKTAAWLMSTVEQISKQPSWRQVPLLVEPWNDKFVVKNVIQLTLPWKFYRGNNKSAVIQRLRKANVVHGSNRWNLIGCKLDKFKIHVTLAVNQQTMESLKRTQFYVFYGFSQYRCQVVKTAQN